MQPEAIFTVVALIFSIILHEVAHGYAAWVLGDPTAKNAGRLTLNPLPHIDPLGSLVLPGMLVLTGASILLGWAKPVPYDPRNLRNGRAGEAVVAVAGAATNLGLAALFALIYQISIGIPGAETFAGLAAIVVWVNLFLAVFNLMPVPPLDGFTVLRNALPYRAGGRWLEILEYRVAELGPMGLVAALLVVFFLLTPVVLYIVNTLAAFLIGT